MPLVTRFAVLLAAVLLCAPAAAIAQTPTATSTIEQEGAGVSTQPPVELGDGEEEPQANTPPPAAAPAPADPAANSDLPNTGSDPRLLFLAGVALMLFGVGLRLRTADADLY